MGSFGHRLCYGTEYLEVPKWDPNFGGYPFGFLAEVQIVVLFSMC